MTRIDFYVLGEGVEADLYACRLAEKAYKRGLRIVLRSRDAGHSQRLDELLWSFRSGSFVPHDTRDEKHSVVWICHADEPHGNRPLLINLSNEMPSRPEAYPRIAEIIGQDPEVKQRGRDRFRRYRELGFELESHEVSR